MTWASEMEISALRFLGLNDFIPGGIHDPARPNVTGGWVRWFDLRRHAIVLDKTATMQNRGEKRPLTNYILDLGLYCMQVTKPAIFQTCRSLRAVGSIASLPQGQTSLSLGTTRPETRP